MRKGGRILPEYSSLEHRKWWPAAKVTVVAALVFFSIYTGLLIAAGGTQALTIVLMPIIFMFVLILWLLPDVDRVSNGPFYKMITAFMLAKVCWPTYVSVVIPGLPWINPPRVVLFAMIGMLVVHLAQNVDARRRVGDIFGYDRWAVRAFFLFVLGLIMGSPLSPTPFGTVLNGINFLTLMMFAAMAAAYSMTNLKNVERMLSIIAIGAIITMLITILENYMQVPPWINYIPSFMRVDEELMAEYLSPQSRFFDNRYRIRATFTHVLFYAQYLNIVLPLLIYTVWRMRKTRPLLAIMLFGLILQTVWYCNARTAVIGLLISILGYASLCAVRIAFFRRGGDPIISSITAFFIVMFIGLGALTVASSHRLTMMTIGGVQHNSSDNARDGQWQNAWAQLARNPIGIGIENVQDKVGVMVHGKLILDSAYINLLVGAGPLGFLGFIGCLARVAYLGVITFLRATEPDDDYGGIIALGLINYIITLYVISHFDNNYLVAVIAVLALALHRAQAKRLAAQAPAPAAMAARNGRAIAIA